MMKLKNISHLKNLLKLIPKNIFHKMIVYNKIINLRKLVQTDYYIWTQIFKQIHNLK